MRMALMSDWLLGSNNLKWVNNDCDQLKELLVKHFGNNLGFYGSVELKDFIIEEVSKLCSTQAEQRIFINKLNKELNYQIRNTNNKQVNVQKIQLEICTNLKQKLNKLSKNADTTKSKYVEGLIRYAHKNPKLFFNEKMEVEVLNVFTKTKNKEIVKVNIASDKLDERLSSLEERLGMLVTLVEPLLSEIQQYNLDKSEVKTESVVSSDTVASSDTEESKSDTDLMKGRSGDDNITCKNWNEPNEAAIDMATIPPSD